MEATVAKLDRAADAAILQLQQRAPAEPLPRRARRRKGAPWLACGFLLGPRSAASKEPAGVVIEGTVGDPDGDDAGGRGCELFSPDVAAADGARPEGLSGSPVIVNGAVVGHLKRILPSDAGRADAGLVYACPIERVEALAGLGPGEAARTPRPPSGPFERSWFVRREGPERIALRRLENLEPVVLTGPPLCGKSMMLGYLLDRIRTNSAVTGIRTRIVELDLGLLAPTPTLTGDVLVQHVADAVLRGCAGEERRYPARSRLLWTTRLTRWMEEILAAGDGRLVLAIDGVGALPDPVHDDFCRMLASWADLAHRAPWSSLRMIMAHTTPALRLDGLARSRPPWSIAPTEIGDLTVGEAEELARAYGLDWSRDELERLLAPHIGGNAFLLSSAFFDAALNHRSIADLAHAASVGAAPFASHLAELFARIQRDPELVSALRALLREPRPDIDGEELHELSAAGVVELRPGEGFCLRNEMYGAYFRTRLR